jgi:hypothetical protein
VQVKGSFGVVAAGGAAGVAAGLVSAGCAAAPLYSFDLQPFSRQAIDHIGF